MAEEATKRKRGRPAASSASKQAKAAEPAPQTEQNTTNEPANRPKKRGRKAAETDEAETEAVRSKRARKSLDTTTANEDVAPKQKKRGRAAKELQQPEEEPTVRKTKKRSEIRPKPVRKSTEGTQEDQGKPKGSKAKRQPLRDTTASEANRPVEAQAEGKRKRGRPSLEKATTAKVSPPAPMRKRGRPSTGSNANEPAQSRAAGNEEEEVPAQRKGRAKRDEEDDLLPPKKYLHVVPFVRGVKQSTIDAKWKPLGTQSIIAAETILEHAHHPVVQRMSQTQDRREHTDSALAVAYRRITRKLQKGLPFPPAGMPSSSLSARARDASDGGREIELKFENVINGERALEKQLDPALHAVELLRREKARMERELERDYVALRNLEAGARTQAREQREKVKRAHVLAPDGVGRPKLEGVEMVFDNDGVVSQGNTFKDLEDGEVKDLALQLSGHMDSIKTNLQQTDGLLSQMASTKSALRVLLQQHLDQKSSERVVLGN